MYNRQVRPNLTPLAFAVAGCLWGSAALAQDARSAASSDTAGQIQEVVVTAQRDASAESKTPVSMSVVSGEALASSGLDRPADIGARLPGVSIDGAAAGLRITIRGVSNADATEKGEPSAAFMLDGVYIARPHGQNLDFLDVERVEVLRGPQGTLYGRNTTAGVVNVISKAPTDRFEGEAGAEMGNHGSRKASAAINLPLSEGIALRAAVSSNRRDSLLRNAQGTPHTLGQDRDADAARLSARFALAPAASLLLRLDRTVQRDNNDVIVPDTNFYRGIETGNPAPFDASTAQRLTNAFVPPNTVPEQGHSRRASTGFGAEFAWDLGPATLHYLGAHRRFDHDFLVNYYYRIKPGFALGVRQDYDGRFEQDSHELRLASNVRGPVSAQGGVYWFRERMAQLTSFRDLEPIGLPPYYVFPSDPVISYSRGLFGQLTWSAGERLRFTLGARRTDDRKSRYGSTNLQQQATFNPATDIALPNAASLATSKTTWRAGVDVDLAPSTMAYATVSTGYKAGGFNDGCAAGTGCPALIAVPASTLVYQPETLTAYELGLKTRFWNKRASLNLSAFRYAYDNLQLSGVAIVRGVPRYVTTNAGEASVKGLEVEGALKPLPQGRLSYTLALLDAHYVAYSPDGVHSLAGYKLDRAPRAVVTLGYEHGFALRDAVLTAGVFARRSSEWTIGVPSQLLRYRIPARTATDLRLGYQPANAPWNVLLRVKNLENKVEPVNIDSFGMTVPSEPRAVALRVDYRF